MDGPVSGPARSDGAPIRKRVDTAHEMRSMNRPSQQRGSEFGLGEAKKAKAKLSRWTMGIGGDWRRWRGRRKAAPVSSHLGMAVTNGGNNEMMPGTERASEQATVATTTEGHPTSCISDIIL